MRGEIFYKKKRSMKCQLKAASPFVCVSLIDYSLKPRSQPCLLFEHIMQSRCCGHPKMSAPFHVVTSPSVSGSLNALGLFLVALRGAGKSFPWSQLISLTIKAHCGLQQEETQAECAATAGV